MNGENETEKEVNRMNMEHGRAGYLTQTVGLNCRVTQTCSTNITNMMYVIKC